MDNVLNLRKTFNNELQQEGKHRIANLSIVHNYCQLCPPGPPKAFTFVFLFMIYDVCNYYCYLEYGL